jgi:hypothetical protein
MTGRLSSSGARRGRRALRLLAVILLVASFTGSFGCASGGGAAAANESVEHPSEGDEERRGRIEPRYQPREPEEEPFYDSDYLFGITRAVTNSTMVPAGKVPLLLLTIPLDIAFLPFAAIGGFF